MWSTRRPEQILFVHPLYTRPISLQWPTGHVLPPNILESGRGRSGRFTHIAHCMSANQRAHASFDTTKSG